VLHREQRRRGARGDPELPVGVLDVVVGRLDRDPQRPCDLLGLQAAGQQPKDLGLPLGEAGWPLDPRDAPPDGLHHRGHRVGVQPSSARLLADGLGGLVWRERPAVRPRLGHRVIGVGGGQQPGGARERRGGRPPVVAGAVEPLVVEGGDRRETSKERRAGKDALGPGRRAT
jgi:hypothetical protein